MLSIDELIERFWTGEMSEEERLQLQDLLIRQEKQLTEEMRTVFFALRKEGRRVLAPERGELIRQRLETRIQSSGTHTASGEQSRVVPMRRRRWAVAAVLILLAGSGMLVLLNRKPGQRGATITDRTSDGYHRPLRQLKQIANTADTMRTLVLADGSQVRLQGHSALAYYEPFYDSSRDISLTGVATFTVEKDTRRPFTVYAEGIATTALGTVFTVNTRETNKVSVLLLEGKVRVRATDSNADKTSQPMILSPGQEFTMNMVTRQSLVIQGSSIKTDLPLKPGHFANVPSRQKEGGGGNETVLLSFSNEPLASVFYKINKLYGTDIHWNNKDIEGLYFTGSILKGDSIHIVLSAIGNMNRLAFTGEKGYIQVKKSN